jgi:hypothetical protein
VQVEIEYTIWYKAFQLKSKLQHGNLIGRSRTAPLPAVLVLFRNLSIGDVLLSPT